MIVALCVAFAIVVGLGGLYVMMEVKSSHAETVCFVITLLCIAGGIWFFTHLAPAPSVINIGNPDTSVVITVTEGQVVVRPQGE